MRLILCLLLAGCASGEPYEVVSCRVPVTENAGMGVKVNRCAAWVIGDPDARPIIRVTR